MYTNPQSTSDLTRDRAIVISPEEIQIVVDSLPPNLESFADTVLHCEGCVRLLCFLAHRPHMANTESDLARLLDESISVVRHALDALASQGAIQQITVAGQTFYHLTQDQTVLVRISEFLNWREQWVERAQWLMHNLEVDKQSESQQQSSKVMETN